MRKLVAVLILAAGAALGAPAPATYPVDLAWDPPVPAEGVTGYILYWGTAAGVYPNSRDVGLVLTGSVTGLQWNVTYHYAVTAYNADRVESDYSVPLAREFKKPGRPTLKQIILKLLGR